MKSKQHLIAVALMAALVSSVAQAQAPPNMKMTTLIPAEITTPDSIEMQYRAPL